VITTLTIDRQKQALSGPADIIEKLRGPYAPETAEVWLRRDDGPALLILLNDRSSFLMFQRDRDDAGQHTFDPTRAGVDVEFRLSNGLWEDRPAEETVTRDEAIRAAEHFVETGEAAPWISWQDDRMPDSQP
jgi:hypothetical protein